MDQLGTAYQLEKAPRANLRWTICGLLFFATTVNYIDRQVLGILKPTLQRELGWHESDYSWVVFAFQCAYAVMMPIAGRIIDWLGTRVGYALAVVVWSLASMSHALARTTTQFAIARFALGAGEAANFPAAVKTIAAWFPQRQRALATGIFNSGSNIGAIVAPLMVPFFALRFGWRSAFIATGSLDFVWLAAWLLFFRMHPQPREAEREEQIHYSRLFGKRQAWILLLGKFLTDPAWWFYLFWLPGFLNSKYGLDLAQLGPPLVAIYVAADLGSIGGGWLSSSLRRPRLDHKPRPQDRNVRLRLRCAAHDRHHLYRKPSVGRGRSDQPRGSVAPGMVGQYLHTRVRHVPARRRRHGGRIRRRRRSGQRHARCARHRLLAGLFPQRLRASVFYLRINVSGSAPGHPSHSARASNRWKSDLK